MAQREMATREQEAEGELLDPFREFHGAPFGGLFEDFFAPMRAAAPSFQRGWLPKADVRETEKEYLLGISVPGVRKEDLKVDVRDDVLTVTGERKAEKEEKGKTWLRRESAYGSFSRSFVLPEGVRAEEVKASCQDGVLTLVIPKPQGQQAAAGVNVKIA